MTFSTLIGIKIKPKIVLKKIVIGKNNFSGACHLVLRDGVGTGIKPVGMGKTCPLWGGDGDKIVSPCNSTIC